MSYCRRTVQKLVIIDFSDLKRNFEINAKQNHSLRIDSVDPFIIFQNKLEKSCTLVYMLTF